MRMASSMSSQEEILWIVARCANLVPVQRAEASNSKQNKSWLQVFDLVVIWLSFGISLWKEKEALTRK